MELDRNYLFEVEIEGTEVLEIDVEAADTDEVSVDLECVVIMSDKRIEKYEGPYEVTPSVDGFVLETKGKAMDENLSVLDIPVFETGNIYGTTIHIAPTTA